MIDGRGEPAGPDEAILIAHVARFNEGVRSGDYEPMLAAFAPDAEMVFEGLRTGPFIGRDAIRAAYAAQPPTDEILLVGPLGVGDCTVTADYAWAAEGRRAGRLLLTTRDGSILRLLITFE